ncbi:DUF805 domain-containing protein [Fodinibius halophilus]|uniref:DUF805 domain-containing protein n=1 Tax=Fodinibius halophilus TaxID=1736908 RepID=A0A6M1T1N5_9BACT|nr:DUF805 domain-containing protein [Fodinibius halophilus]NGP89396.1 DUF805 domain-containing protein [Fodinibius halophilus]
MEWYLKVLNQYADFEGRARRKEYWMFALINMGITFGILILSGLLALITSEPTAFIVPAILLTLYSLAIVIPGLAVTIRRLHDTNRSGWWMFINFVPLVGPIALFIFLVEESHPGKNQYGANPKGINDFEF